jgi:hypothetical protein
MKAYWESGGIAAAFLTSALDGDEWSASPPGRFTPRERARGTHWIGGWVGPRAVLDVVVKRKIPSLRRESNPRTPIIQPLHYFSNAGKTNLLIPWSGVLLGKLMVTQLVGNEPSGFVKCGEFLD